MLDMIRYQNYHERRVLILNNLNAHDLRLKFFSSEDPNPLKPNSISEGRKTIKKERRITTPSSSIVSKFLLIKVVGRERE